MVCTLNAAQGGPMAGSAASLRVMSRLHFLNPGGGRILKTRAVSSGSCVLVLGKNAVSRCFLSIGIGHRTPRLPERLKLTRSVCFNLLCASGALIRPFLLFTVCRRVAFLLIQILSLMSCFTATVMNLLSAMAVLLNGV